MYTVNTTAFGPVRSDPESDGLSGTERDSTAQVTLAGVRDWVRLCQRCANSEPQSGTRHQPAPAEPLRAVVIPFKTRRAR